MVHNGSCNQFVLSNKLSNELWADAFQVDSVLTHRQIVFQILLMDAAKGSQKVARRGPQPFDGVAVNLAHAIAIIITRPLMLAVTNRPVRSLTWL